MEKLEEEQHCMLRDVAEGEEVVEMSRARRHRRRGNQVQVTTDNVLEELGKGPGMHRRCCDLTRKALRVVGDSLIVSWDWKMFADSLIVP